LSRPGTLPRIRDGIRHALAVGLVALVALLSKENGALVPFLLLAITIALPRDTWRTASDTTGKRTFWSIAVAVPASASDALCVAFWDVLAAGFAFRDFTVGERLLSQPPILASYLQSFFLPDLRKMGLYLDDVEVLTAGDPIAWVGVAAVVVVHDVG